MWLRQHPVLGGVTVAAIMGLIPAAYIAWAWFSYRGADPLFYSDGVPLSAVSIARPFGSVIGFSVLGDIVYERLGALAFSVLIPLLNAVVLGLLAGTLAAAGQRVHRRFWPAT